MNKQDQFDLIEEALSFCRYLVDKAQAYDAAHSELERSNNELGACRRVTNTLRENQQKYEQLLEAIKKIPLGDEYGHLQPWEEDIFNALQNLDANPPKKDV